MKQYEYKNVSTSGMEHESPPKRKKGLSMHEDVPVWYDCCSCEAEPYWVEIGEDQITETNHKEVNTDQLEH